MADLFLLDGAPVIEATITLPRVGLWTAVVMVDTTDAPATSATLTAPGLELVGTVRRVGVHRDSARVELVGAGALATTSLAPKAYRNVPARIPLTDAVSDAGVTLAATADASLLAYSLPHWIRAAGTSKSEIAQLARAVGASWRALPDGTVWLGEESWSESTLAHDLLSESPESDRVEIWSESLDLRPGESFLERHVSAVSHAIRASQVRTTVWFET